VPVARAIRDLTRALLICCGAVGALGLAGVAILTLAQEDRTGLLPALTLLGLCQVFALVGGAVVAVGLRAALGRRRTDAAPGRRDAARAWSPDATPDDAERAEEASAVVARRLHLLARVVLAACVLAVAAWALADSSTAVGALLGALVGAQVAVVFELLARRLARA
jgi:hypothetical protein